jgi:hypothetical protein
VNKGINKMLNEMKPSSGGKINIIIALVLISVFQIVLASNKRDENNPAIKFAELSFDFGKVQQGVLLEHDFSFTNEGDAKLIIQSVQPSCGCTGASIGDKKEFDNDESGEIKITFNTGGRSGNISKTVTVTSNDPANPQVTLTFTCEIQ